MYVNVGTTFHTKYSTISTQPVSYCLDNDFSVTSLFAAPHNTYERVMSMFTSRNIWSKLYGKALNIRRVVWVVVSSCLFSLCKAGIYIFRG